MPRKPLIQTADFPYHIQNRSNNREFFYVDKPTLWVIFSECLNELEKQYGCELHTFVMMSNHYHLICSTPEMNIGEAMKYFHREVARKANKHAGRINHFFGGRYKWSVIGNEIYYWNAVKYNFRNPVRAGICNSVEEYLFSSLNDSSREWKLFDPFQSIESTPLQNTEWFDQPFLHEQETAIGLALRRREFELPRTSSGFSVTLDAPLRKKGTVTREILDFYP